MLVDDDAVDRESLRRAFRAARIDADVREAEGAEVALELLAADPGGFDLGIFDLHLPGRDGLELLTELRAAGVDLPVIFLTGQGSEERAVELMKAGASDYLPKGSLSPPRLLQSIRQTMRLARTERAHRAAEQALRESEAAFRRLAENLPDAILRCDRTGRQRYVNQRLPWSQATTVAELLGQTIGESGCDPVIAATLEAALQQALDGEPAEVTLRLAPGGSAARWLEVRFVPEGEAPVASALGIARDVTAEVVRHEDEQRRTEFERQLIGIVSHDLRGPIGAMLIGAQLLKRKLADGGDEGITRILDVLDRSGHRAKRMVSDLLDFTQARLGGGIPMHFADCDLAEVARQLVAETRTTYLHRGIDLAIEGPAVGHFDADRIAQALGNLVVNAITYSPPTEAVTVRVVGTETEVQIAVHSRGPTIPPATLPRLFKPFQRGQGAPAAVSDHDASRSVGLGLFIVDEIVQGHHGRIEVLSDAGVTVFTMILPRLAEGVGHPGACAPGCPVPLA